VSVLVLGAEGMLGSVLMRWPETYGTTRRHTNNPHILAGIDITRFDDLRRALDWCAPEVVINCAGIVKSECGQHRPELVIATNSVAPHILAALTAPLGCRVIHVSTDCVFDGTRGARKESDPTDATDLYGQTKAAGELVGYDHCVTLRTSFIGRDPVHKRGLLEWLLEGKGRDAWAVGYTNAMWSGLSTHELARAIRVSVDDKNLKGGLYHVVGPLISKADLLQMLIDAYNLPCRLRLEGEPHIDRSLYGSKFTQATGYCAPSWATMAEELANVP
jgi:dTDP-4-dehydrorhamnose reductase